MSAEVVEATLEDVTSDTARLIAIEQKVEQILSFCNTLAAMLDAMGENPMIAAMMPPGVFSTD